MGKRIWEIDLIRVFCIGVMITYHTIYNLIYFFDYTNLSLTTPAWNVIAPSAGFLFIFLSGISSGFSRKNLGRGFKVFCYGLVITAVTYLAIKEDYIRFGILHFLGISMMLYPLLSRLRPWMLMGLAALLTLIWPTVDSIQVSTFLLLPLGFTYSGFSTADYFPILQYLPAFLLGIVAYKLYYHRRQSIFPFQLRWRPIELVSSFSLQIYLLHQPIIMGLLFLWHSII